MRTVLANGSPSVLYLSELLEFDKSVAVAMEAAHICQSRKMLVLSPMTAYKQTYPRAEACT